MGKRKKHGMWGTRIYRIWGGMRTRCINPNSPDYKNYGGRGIKVCDRWRDFKNFYEDMKDGYKDNLTIDRINNNGNYELLNCKWRTVKQQSRNTRTNVFYKGKSQIEWAEEKGINPGTLCERLKNGWSWEKALNTPVKKCTRTNYKGKCMAEWARIIGITPESWRLRLKKGWTWEKAINTPRTDKGEKDKI